MPSWHHGQITGSLMKKEKKKEQGVKGGRRGKAWNGESFQEICPLSLLGFKSNISLYMSLALVLGEDPAEAERTNQTSMRAVSSGMSASTKGKLKQRTDPRGEKHKCFLCFLRARIK